MNLRLILNSYLPSKGGHDTYRLDVACQSIGGEAMATPLKPPTTNSIRKATAKSIGVAKCIFPPHMVAVQFNTFIPVGIAINMLAIAKKALKTLPRPTANM